MMRAHGIAPNAASIKPAPQRAPKSERRDSSAPLKKRKADQFLEDTAADDDEAIGWGSSSMHIKDDPHTRDEKHLVFKSESGSGGSDIKPQGLGLGEEQGCLNLEQAANLMQYYDNGSQPSLLVDDLYSAGDYGGGISAYGTSSGYATSMGSGYGLDSQSGYYASPYNSAGMGGMGGLSSVPRTSQQGYQYQQHRLPYQPDDQGHPDSPLIVE